MSKKNEKYKENTINRLHTSVCQVHEAANSEHEYKSFL